MVAYHTRPGGVELHDCTTAREPLSVHRMLRITDRSGCRGTLEVNDDGDDVNGGRSVHIA